MKSKASAETDSPVVTERMTLSVADFAEELQCAGLCDDYRWVSDGVWCGNGLRILVGKAVKSSCGSQENRENP